jgi:hypothetical protein
MLASPLISDTRLLNARHGRPSSLTSVPNDPSKIPLQLRVFQAESHYSRQQCFSRKPNIAIVVVRILNVQLKVLADALRISDALAQLCLLLNRSFSAVGQSVLAYMNGRANKPRTHRASSSDRESSSFYQSQKQSNQFPSAANSTSDPVVRLVSRSNGL